MQRRTTYSTSIINDRGHSARQLQGDPNTALSFLATYTDFLYRVVRRQYPTIATQDVEDVVGDALYDAFTKRAHYDPFKGSLETWLAVRTIWHARRFNYHQSHIQSDVSLDIIAPQIKTVGYDEVVDPKIVSAIEKLPPKQSEAIKQRYLHHESDSQIARIMAIKEPSVRSLVKRGLDKLKVLLHTTYIEQDSNELNHNSKIVVSDEKYTSDISESELNS